MPVCLPRASMGHAVLLTLPSDHSYPAWSYRHTGTLPRLISFVSHSYENTGGVGVFFPFWNSLVGCRGFDPGNECLPESSTDCCQLITDHCPLTFPACPDPVGDGVDVTATLALSCLDATLRDLPASVANKGLTALLNPLDATLTKKRGGTSAPATFGRSDLPTFRRWSDVYPFLSDSCALPCTFLHQQKIQLFCFQAFPHSASKNTKGGRTAPSVPSVPGHRSRFTSHCHPGHRQCYHHHSGKENLR